MAGVNKVIIVGNLGNDPEVRTFPNGDAVANISVATSDRWQDKQTGEWREVTEWHRIVLFRRLAEIAGEYLRRGSKVYIEGKLRTRKWQDQNGQDRYSTEIQADNLQMLDSRADRQQGGYQQAHAAGTQAPQASRSQGYGQQAPISQEQQQGYQQPGYAAPQQGYQQSDYAAPQHGFSAPQQNNTKPTKPVAAPPSTPEVVEDFADDDIPF